MSKQQMSDIKRAEDTTGVLRQTHIGGQALIEGVMMRGKYNWAAAIRQPDGNIYIEEHDVATRPDKHSWLYWPVIRGCRALVESLMLGYKALGIAADHAFDFDDEEDSEDSAGSVKAESNAVSDDYSESNLNSESLSTNIEAPTSVCVQDSIECTKDDPVSNLTGQANCDEGEVSSDSDQVVTQDQDQDQNKNQIEDEDSESKGVFVIGTILGVALGVAAFIMLPAFVTNLVMGDYNSNPIAWNIVDGIARVAIFILYVWAISFMQDIKRLFMYHGAEHKTIHCYEHGLELTPQNAAQFTTLHVRCGTAFLIMTLILAIIVFSFAPIKEICVAFGLGEGLGQFGIIVLSRIVLIPLVAGLGYEVTVKWAGAHPEKKLVKLVLWPGLQMQKLTTSEPDESMLECAIASMKAVLEREEAEEAKAAGVPVEAGEAEEAGEAGEKEAVKVIAPQKPVIVDSFSASA